MRDALLHLLRLLFFGVVVRGVILLVLGLTVRHRDRLPRHGPAVIAANHNSHLDTLVLMSLFPLPRLDELRPVAAADYFTQGGLGWFAANILRIIPVERGSGGKGGNPLAACEAALDRGEILIIFPEGSRGEPEALARIKKGIGHLARARPSVPVIPVYMHGLGKALPKGTCLLVPFNCTVSVGAPLYGDESYDAFVAELESAMQSLAAQEKVPAWE